MENIGLKIFAQGQQDWWIYIDPRAQQVFYIIEPERMEGNVDLSGMINLAKLLPKR